MAKDEATTAAPDPLGVDDRAWAIVPPARLRTVLLVSEGDPYLETALSYLPDTELWGTTPDRYASDVIRPDGTSWDLVIFEGFLPDELPPTPDPRHRAAVLLAAGHRGRDAGEPGHRQRGFLRPDPALRGPHHGPRRRGAEDGAARLGPARDPGARHLAAAVRRDARRTPGGGDGLRAAPLRPAAPGGVPGPAREPRRASCSAAPRRRSRRSRPARPSPWRSPPGPPASGSSAPTAAPTSSSPRAAARPASPSPAPTSLASTRVTPIADPDATPVAHPGPPAHGGGIAVRRPGVARRLARRSAPPTRPRPCASRWACWTWTSRASPPATPRS